MTGLGGLEICLHAFAAIIAAWVAWRHREHRPLAVFLVFTALADGGACALQAFVLKPARLALGPAPYTGDARIAFHIWQALFMSWCASLAASAFVVLGRRRSWLAFLAFVVWAFILAAMVARYPEIRGEALQRWYLAAELGALAVGMRYAAGWLRRMASRNKPALSAPEILVGSCVFILVAVDATGVAVGAWRGNIYRDWHLSQISYAVEYAVLIVLQIGGGICRIESQAVKGSSSSS